MIRQVCVHGVDFSKKSGSYQILWEVLGRRGLKPVSLEHTCPYILCLGAPAHRAVCGSTEDLSVARGKIHQATDGRLVFTTFHPGSVSRNRRLLPLFKADLESFATLVKFDSG